MRPCADCGRPNLPDEGPEKICPRCRYKRQRLWPPGSYEAELRNAYYSVLNKEEKFRAALQDLFKRLAAIRARRSSPSPKARALLIQFVKQWHLPGKDGPADVWNSLGVRLADRHRLKPTLTAQFPPLGNPSFFKIVPKYPAFILYEPSLSIPAERKQAVEGLTKEFRASVLAQMEERDQQAKDHGWRQTPPQHRDRARLDRLALRLYRRAVLEWPWQRITATERKAEPDGGADGTQAVRNSVNNWARTLMIPLPRSPRGRPRRQT